MANPIPIAKPWTDAAEVAAAQRPILSGWLTQGPEVAAFEREFAALVSAPYACAVANCTVALQLALQVVGVTPGSEVITVSHSYIATANSIRALGALPVFVDVETDTYNIDSTQLAAAISPLTRAVLVVHQLGLPCDLTQILPVARAHGLPVVEDAACAIGSEIYWQGQWQPIGLPHADIACFSFHPRKLITTGDGGMLTTANEHYDRQFRLLRQHGMSVPDTVRHAAAQVIFESYPVIGYNYRLTDVQAAIGREQLKKLPTMLAKRRALADRYQTLLSALPGLGLPRVPAWTNPNWQSYCVRLPTYLEQRQVMQHLLDEGIATRRGVMCAHREPAYAQQPFWRAAASLTHSEFLQDHALILPLFPQMTEAEQDRVVDALSSVLRA